MKRMKKSILLASVATAALALTACSGEVNIGKDEEEFQESVQKEVQKFLMGDGEFEDDVKVKETVEKNEVIYDKDGITVTYLGFKTQESSFYGEEMEIMFDVKNNLDKNVELNPEFVSADDRMIDDNVISGGASVSPGKTASLKVTIAEFNKGAGLPKIEENIEMTLNVYDWDEFEMDVPLKVKLK